jgi:MFS transporter, ACS family, pantothenate transporter
MTIDEKKIGNLNVVSEEGDNEVIQLKPQKKWTSYLWDTLDKSPRERKFLFKLGAAILGYGSLGMCFETSHPSDGFED